MPSFKIGYSEKHDKDPRWLYCAAFDVHCRLTFFKQSYTGVVTEKRNCESTPFTWINYKGFILPRNLNIYKQKDIDYLFSGFGVDVLHTDKKPFQIVDNYYFYDSYAFDDYSLFKKNGIIMYVHYQNKMIKDICISCNRVASKANSKSGKIWIRKPKTGLTSIVTKNLVLLQTIFESLNWDMKSRFSWWQLVMSSDKSNYKLALEMLQTYFNERSTIKN